MKNISKSFKTPKGTELPLLDLKGKDYLQVAHRLVWFREEKPNWSIETEYVQLTDTYAIAKATIRDETGRIMAQAHKREDKTHFQDFTEKSQTGAIGRALALVGFGTAFSPDLDEGERIVDSPVERAQSLVGSTKSQVQGDELTVPFGKNKGMPISSLSPEQMNADLCYWTERIKKEGKPASGKLKEYLEALEVFLTNVENEDVPMEWPPNK